MKPLNITEEERSRMYVTYDTNKYVMYCKTPFGFTFMSSYPSKEALKTDMELNNIAPQFDHGASMKYLEEIGAF